MAAVLDCSAAVEAPHMAASLDCSAAGGVLRMVASLDYSAGVPHTAVVLDCSVAAVALRMVAVLDCSAGGAPRMVESLGCLVAAAAPHIEAGTGCPVDHRQGQLAAPGHMVAALDHLAGHSWVAARHTESKVPALAPAEQEAEVPVRMPAESQGAERAADRVSAAPTLLGHMT